MSRVGWMPDSSSTQCYECGARFTTLRRKHHCRICGRIFCNQCSNYEVPGKVIGQSGFVRACEFCKKTVNECSSLNRPAPTTVQDSFSPEIDASTFTRASSANFEKNRPSTERNKAGKIAQDDGNNARNTMHQSHSAMLSAALSGSNSSINENRMSHPFGLASNAANQSSDSIANDSVNEEEAQNRAANNLAASTTNRDRFRLKWVEKRIPQRDVAGWLVRFRTTSMGIGSSARLSNGGDVVAEIETRLDEGAAQEGGAVGTSRMHSKTEPTYDATEKERLVDRGASAWPPTASAKSDVLSQSQSNEAEDSEASEGEREPIWFRDIRTHQSTLLASEALPNAVSDERPPETAEIAKANESQPEGSDSAKPNCDQTEQNSESDYDECERLETPATTELDVARPDAQPAETDNETEKLFRLFVEFPDTVNEPDAEPESKYENGSISETEPEPEPEPEPELCNQIESPYAASFHPPTARAALIGPDANSTNVTVDYDEQVRAAHKAHLVKLIRQLVAAQYLPNSWTPVVYQLCRTVTTYIDPSRAAQRPRDSTSGQVDFAFNSLSTVSADQSRDLAREAEGDGRPGPAALITDIREHVHIKKVPSRQQTESDVVFGVVATKNAALRSMARAVLRPRVLVLRCSLEYQRAANKYAAFDLQIEQEREFLRNVVERVLALHPTVVVVENAIAQLALEMLKQAGDLVVLTNVKSTVVDRLVQFTRADAVQSVEALMLVSQPGTTSRSRLRLGTCDRFRIVELREPDGSRRSLVYFEHVPRSSAAFNGILCSVELAGADYSELRRVKRVLRTALFAFYHARLELAFLADCKARLHAEMLEKLADENEDERELLARFRGRQADLVAASPSSPSPSRAYGVHVRKVDAHRRKASHDPLAAVTDESNRPAAGSDLELVHENGSDANEPESPPDDSSESLRPSSDGLAYQPVVLRPQTVVPRSPFAPILDDVLLSVSPFVHAGVPYLQQHSVLSLLNVSPQTLAAHTPCALIVLERVDPTRLFWSAQFESAAVRDALKRTLLQKCAEFQRRKALTRSPSRHALQRRCDDFLEAPLTLPDGQLQDRLAMFRASGCSYVFDANDLRRGTPWNCSNAGVQQMVATQREHAARHASRDAKQPARRDCLELHAHQRIALLYCFFAPESSLYPAYCNEPSIVPVRFYGENDVSVRRFLTDFCFAERACASCRLPIDKHIRRFVHANGCVHVTMKPIDNLTCVSASDAPNNANNVPDAQAKLQQLKLYCASNIATWRRCKQCARATKIVMFSSDASQMSFGKFLELCFHASAYQLQPAAHGNRANAATQPPPPCDHDLFRDFDHYFAHRDRVVILRHSEIALREICLPPKRVARAFTLHAVQKSVPLVDEVRTLLSDVQQFYNDLFELIRMNGLMEECFDSAKREYDVVRQRVDTLGRCVDEYAAVTRLNQAPQSTNQLAARPSIASISRVNSILHCSVTVPLTDLTLEHVNLIRDVFVKLQCELAVAQQTWNAQLGKTGTKLKKLPSTVRRLGSIANIETNLNPKNSLTSSSPLNVPNTKRVGVQVSPLGGTPNSNEPEVNATSVPSNDDDTARNNEIAVASAILLSPTESASSDSVVTQTLADVKRPRDEKTKSVLSGLLRVFVGEDTRAFELTYAAELHPLLPMGRLPVLVNDQQPTSIIAYALTSDNYVRELDALRKQNADPVATVGLQKGARSDKAARSHAIELEFEDETTKFYCKVFHAAEFDELRRLFLLDTCTNACCSSDPEAFFLRSLSRCAKWRAPGGKSGSAFCKTSDERFVLKELNSFEMQSFLQFAPQYFEYMRAHAQSSASGPAAASAGANANTVGFSAIVKIFGYFRLGHKNSRTDTSSKQDVLIMENLFYGKRLAQVFDLKGSMRNRLTKPTGGDGDLVLMDENLLKMSIANPFYVRSHSKQVLLECIRADTDFLARHAIIDYSLLVGVTQPSVAGATGELVVGIIDIIRQFTWDKRLESVVKSSLPGSKGQMPTIVNPELYRKRFIEAMHTYFLVIPDSWFSLGEPVDLARKPRPSEDERATAPTG